MDLLSETLRELRLESVTYRVLALRAPWRLRFDGGLRGVHIVVRGSCTLRLDGGDARSVEEGDLLVLPRADSHTLTSPGGEHARELSSLALARQTPGPRLQAGGAGNAGGAGEESVIVCGAFFLGEVDHPAMSSLPSCIQVPAHGGQATEWLRGLSAALVAEADEGGPGSEIVMARLSDALVTRALRHHLQTADEPGWLRGLRDPAMARALTALHADLAGPWSVASLARTADMSRAAFAARFQRTMGQAPMAYVTQVRIRTAMALLRSDRATVATVASRVGYGSEAALSAAFLRHTRTTPGAYRRAAAQTVEAEPPPMSS